MAVRRPVFIDTVTGELTRFSVGDTVAEVDVLTVDNNTGGALVIGTPVTSSGVADGVSKADADALATAKVLGLVSDVSIANLAQGSVLTDGRLSATTAQWDAVTGQVGGLTPGSRYYVSAGAAGTLTTVPPTADGNVIAPVGTAKSTTEMEITIGTRIVL